MVLDARVRPVGRELFDYSLWVGIQRFVISVSNGFDRLVVSAFLGPAAVPVYWICMRVIRIVPGTIGTIGKRAVMPIAAELQSTGGDASVHDLVRRGTRVYVAAIFVVIALLVVYAEPVLAALGGATVAALAWACQASLLLQAPVISRGVLMQASIIKTETARDSAFVGVVLAVLHVVLLALAADAGALGAAILSWSVAHVLLAPWWIHRMAHHIGLPVGEFYGAALRGGWPGALLVLLHVPFIGQLASAPVAVTIIAAGVSALVALGAAWFLGIDAASRRALLARALRSGDAASADPGVGQTEHR